MRGCRFKVRGEILKETQGQLHTGNELPEKLVEVGTVTALKRFGHEQEQLRSIRGQMGLAWTNWTEGTVSVLYYALNNNSTNLSSDQ